MSQTSAQILSHPRWGSEFLSDDEKLIYTTRMNWIRIVNKAVLGVLVLNEEHKKSIRILNQLLRKYGWEPLHPDFETL